MKKTFNIAAVSLAVMSANAIAQDTNVEFENWIGLHGMYYNADVEKPADDFLEDGMGFGGEYGWRFDRDWAVRAEFTALDLDTAQLLGTDDSVSGVSWGADIMYFAPRDLWYLFGGYKRQDFDTNHDLVNAGIGKHWDIGKDVKITTEIAALYDWDDSYADYSAKVGVMFPIGGSPASAAPTPAPQVNNDTDNDGVMNNMDECPNTPAGAEVDARGCEIVGDSDNDGVNDDRDQCADTPMNDKVDADGCTVFEKEEVEHTLRVLFASESAEIQDPDSQDIQDFVDFFNRYGKTDALIEGHASAPGEEDYNMALSQRRADAFKDLLVERYDIDASRLSTKGFGESQLLMEGSSREANRMNRRIHIRVTATVEKPEQRN